MLVLKLFGAVYLEDETGVVTGPAAQRHRLALLAILAASQPRAVPREKLMALLWPERDDEHVRNLLKQSVYVLRKILGDDAIVSAGDALRLEANAIRCDTISFDHAIAESEFQTAIDLYTGPFLDGFYINNSPEFETWVSEQRSRLADACAKALEALASDAEARGDLRTATKYWKSLVTHSPYDTHAVLCLMNACALCGDSGGALRHAEKHERVLKDELEMRPPAEMVNMIARLQGLQLAGLGRQQNALSAAPVNALAPDPIPPISRTWLQQIQKTFGQHWRKLTLIVSLFVLVANLRGLFGDQPPDERLLPESSSVGAGVDEIARLVAHEVDRRLRGDAVGQTPARRTTSIAAYEAYLRGNDPAMLRSAGAARQALSYLRQAVSLDPSYAVAWTGLAKLSMRVAYDDVENADELLTLAEESALKAVQLDDSLAEAHAVMGLLRMSEFDLPAAEVWMKRALALDPARASTREWLVGLHLWMGRFEQALAEAEQATELDPLSPSANAEFARALAANGQCDAALARLETLADVEPPLLRIPVIAAHCLAQKGQWQSAVAVLHDASAQSLGPLGKAMLGYVLARSGQHDEATQILNALREQWQQGDGGAFPVAILFGGFNDRDQVFNWLERSIEDRSLEASADQFTLLQPILDQLQGDPRFARLPMLSPWSKP